MAERAVLSTPARPYLLSREWSCAGPAALLHSLLCCIFALICNLRISATEAKPATPAFAGPWIVWEDAARQPAYGQVRADLPMFGDRQLWAFLTGKEAYVVQVWPKVRLLTWARPGENGDWTVPANWNDGAKPSDRAPDAESDVTLPDAEKEYFIETPSGSVHVRHITFGKCARLKSGDVHELLIHGNCWVRRGGCPNINIAVPVGGQQTFYRNDNSVERSAVGKPERGDLGMVGHYIHVRKDAVGSVEFLGNNQAGDKVYFKSGVAIIGPDSAVLSGPWNRPVVEAPATLVMMSGSWCGQRDFNDGRFAPDSLLVEGALAVGTADRPIARDVTLSLVYKDNGTYPSARGFMVKPGGKVTMHTIDPLKARLVLRWNKVDEEWPKEGLYLNADVPRLVNVALLGEVDLDGVLLMDTEKGGIQLTDPAQRARIKNVQLGKDNASPDVEALFGVFQKPAIAKKKKDNDHADVAAPVVGKAPWETQIWTKTRQLTWAKPGRAGAFEDGANWLEGTKPAVSGPDRTTDVILPSGGQPYEVGDEKASIAVRHVTVEKGACLVARQLISCGNVWIRQGANLRSISGLGLKGTSHSYLRNDNQPKPGPGGLLEKDPSSFWLQDLVVVKGNSDEDLHSVECLGFIWVEGSLLTSYYNQMYARRMGVHRFIVGPDATVLYGSYGRATENRLQLQSGSTFSRHHNQFGPTTVDHWHNQGAQCDISFDYYSAALEAGSPERPLIKDARLLVSGAPEGADMSKLLSLAIPGGQAANMIVTSKNPNSARLVIDWNGRPDADPGTAPGARYISVAILGGSAIDGICFNHLAKGGLRVPTVDVPKQWRHMTFGPDCQGKEANLVKPER